MSILKSFPDDCKKERPVLFVRKLKQELNDDQIKTVLELIESICLVCWDNTSRCTCMRDE